MNWVLVGAACLLFSAGVTLAFYDRDGGATLTYGAAIFCLIFAFLARFKRFKGLGVEAELWEQQVEKAVELIDKLRALSTAVAEPLLTMSARIGRWDSAFTHRESFDLLSSLTDSLKRSGVSDEDIARARHEFDRTVARDMLAQIIAGANKPVQQKEAQQRKIVDAFPQPITDIAGYNAAIEKWRAIGSEQLNYSALYQKLPSASVPDEIDQGIDRMLCLSAAEKEALKSELDPEMEDLRVWLRERRLRRPEVFLAD